MRHSNFHSLCISACAVLLGSLVPLAAATAADAAPAVFSVLARPALPALGAGEAMLAVASAGKRLVAVGERGIVLLSDDEAKTWRQARVPVSVTLTAVQFVDARLGWAVGHFGVVLHTNDGGATWTRQLDGMQAAHIALQEALGADSAASGRQVADARRLVADGPDKPFLDLYFENELTGYVVGAYNLAFRTDDGGRSWHSWIGRMANPQGVHLYTIKAVGSSLYVAGEQGLLLRSNDQGQHFEVLNSPSKATFFGLLPGRDRELLLYGLQGRAFRSMDDGQTWTQVETGVRNTISAGTRLVDGTIVLATQAGEVIASDDGGRSFRARGVSATVPVTTLLETNAGKLVASSMRGMRDLAPGPSGGQTNRNKSYEIR